MCYEFTVPVPKVPGKITYQKRGGRTYVYYEYARIYHKDKGYNVPRKDAIGKLDANDKSLMYPNPKYYKHFPDEVIPQDETLEDRSKCLQCGGYMVIQKVIEDYHLDEMVNRYFGRQTGLFLDLAAYTILTENNAGQYYPMYAYNHPLFTTGMHIYSDSTVSNFLRSMSADQAIGFLNDWNASRNHNEKIYISYDATNKNCQAGDIDMVEFGYAKDNPDKPIFNYAIAYDCTNREPLFYEDYPGSIVDVSQLQYTLDKAKAYGYRNVGFILDRGYFSKGNIHYMDMLGYQFIIMAKGNALFLGGVIERVIGTFENKRCNFIRKFRVYGITIQGPLYEDDDRDRYFHIYYSEKKGFAERERLEDTIQRYGNSLQKLVGRTVPDKTPMERYYNLEKDKDGALTGFSEKEDAIESYKKRLGYFSIITSEKMTAEEALTLYKSRDSSEKLFRADKSYLGNGSIRVHGNESAEAKIFIEFVALIIRSKIYTLLKDASENADSVQNYMSVPAALKELEKIEMVCQGDGVYRLDHAITKAQKEILSAFYITEDEVKARAKVIRESLLK